MMSDFDHQLVGPTIKFYAFLIGTEDSNFSNRARGIWILVGSNFKFDCMLTSIIKNERT